jgi:hypothetical protein
MCVLVVVFFPEVIVLINVVLYVLGRVMSFLL